MPLGAAALSSPAAQTSPSPVFKEEQPLQLLQYEAVEGPAAAGVKPHSRMHPSFLLSFPVYKTQLFRMGREDVGASSLHLPPRRRRYYNNGKTIHCGEVGEGTPTTPAAGTTYFPGWKWGREEVCGGEKSRMAFADAV